MENLKNTYRTIYQQLLTLSSGCLQLTLEDVFRQMVNDETFEDIMQSLRQLSEKNLQEGLLIHDFSGIGLYGLAFYIAKLWADDTIFNNYKHLIVLPIEHVVSMNVDPSKGLNSLLAVWGGKPNELINQPQEFLVIISGYSAKLRTGNQNQAALIASIEQWLTLISKHQLSYICISNNDNIASLTPGHTLKLSLKPYDLCVTHLANTKEQRQCYIPAKLILAEALSVIEQTFFRAKVADSIKTVDEWHKQIQKYFASTTHIKANKITVPHIYKPLKGQAVIISLLNALLHIDATEPLSGDPLCSPATWYCAAITAINASKLTTACYRLGDTLLVRNLENHYVTMVDFNFAQPTSMLPSVADEQSINSPDDLIVILTKLVNLAEFSKLTNEQLTNKIHEFSAVIKREQRKKNLDKISGKIIKQLLNTLKNEDPAKKRFNRVFGRDQAKEITYNRIQQRVNAEIHEIEFVTSAAREILQGNPSPENKALTLGLAATMLAETKRYPLAFLSTLCLLDCIELESESEKQQWQQFFASPWFSQDSATTEDFSLIEAITKDMAQVIGGLQIMSQGNSYNQISAKQQPKAGLHWVDFKAHIILIHWLSIIIEKEKHLNPYLTGKMIRKRDISVPVISSLFWLSIEMIACLNPYIYDRFYRRLEQNQFHFMLVEHPPFRDIIPHIAPEDIIEWFSENSFIGYPIKIGLPKADNGQVHLNCTLASMGTFFAQALLRPCCKTLPSDSVNFIKKREDFSLERAIKFLLVVLKFDPNFYLVYYYLSIYHINQYVDNGRCDEQLLKSALQYIQVFIKATTTMESRLYYNALYMRLELCYALKWHDLFERLYTEFLEVMQNNEDLHKFYCPVYAYKAFIHYKNDQFDKSYENLLLYLRFFYAECIGTLICEDIYDRVTALIPVLLEKIHFVDDNSPAVDSVEQPQPQAYRFWQPAYIVKSICDNVKSQCNIL